MSVVRSIIIRPEKRGEPKHLFHAVIQPYGVAGDHRTRAESKRAVTLVSEAELTEAAAVIGFHGDVHAASRRNILVDAFPFRDMHGRQVAIGRDVILEVTNYCTPCKRMDDNMGSGAIQALDHRAGWTAIVIREGEISIGDDFRVL